MNTLHVSFAAAFGAASMATAWFLVFGSPMQIGVSGAVAAASFIGTDLARLLKGDQ